MFSINKHFLDSNIVLGKILEDNSEVCKDYFNCDFIRYISKKVDSECQNLFGKLRRVSLSLLTHIQDSIENSDNINLMYIERKIKKFKNSFLNQYNNENCPEGFKKEKFIKIVNALYGEYFEDIKQSILDNNSGYLEKSKKEVKKTYSEAISYLNNILSNLNNIAEYNGNNNDFEEKITNIGIHNSDKFILLDCYELSKNHIMDDVAFITLDNGILSRINELQAIFDINFPIFDPNDYF